MPQGEFRIENAELRICLLKRRGRNGRTGSDGGESGRPMVAPTVERTKISQKGVREKRGVRVALGADPYGAGVEA